MSIAGGVEQAIVRGLRVGCDAVQIFVKSNVRWKMRPLAPGEGARFETARAASGIRALFAHSSYLINLASSDRAVRRRSVRSLAEELRRVTELNLPFIVLHPGSHGGAGIRAGIGRIVAGLDEALEGVPGTAKVLLETTAGQGNSVGGRFEHLAEIAAGASLPHRLGVCLDTCHVFAAGYDIRDERGYARVTDEFDRTVGLRRILAFHLNDCRGGLGSRLDRHAHIGKGHLGLGAFRLLLNDARFAGLPMVLETPKGKEMREDARNLRVLRSLLARPSVRRSRRPCGAAGQ